MKVSNFTAIFTSSMFLLLTSSAALAEEAAADSGLNDITILLHMIRWTGVAASVLIIIGAWLLLRIINNVVRHLGNIFAERRLLLQKFNAFLRFGIYLFTVVLVVLLSFEFSREVLAIIGGGSAVAVGFAAKDLVASLVAGIMIIVDRPFQVGDRVNFGGQYGDIISIGLRSVKLQTLDDNTVTIPNNMFLSGITSCGNYGVLDMQVVIDFHIGMDQDVRQARDLIQEAAATSRFVYLPKSITVLVSQVLIDQCVALRLRLKVYVLDTKYEKQLETDITLRVLDAFAKNNIHPPAILHRQVRKQIGLPSDTMPLATGQSV
jgi:small-conductance mechanosensitive channel